MRICPGKPRTHCRVWQTLNGPGAMRCCTSCRWRLDANMKLLRRRGILALSELQPHLLHAAYQLPFKQSGNRLFGEGLSGVLALNEAYVSKRHTRQLDQVILNQLMTKGAKSKQAHFSDPRSTTQAPSEGERQVQEEALFITASGPKAHHPKEDKSHGQKLDKGKNTSS